MNDRMPAPAQAPRRFRTLHRLLLLLLLPVLAVMAFAGLRSDTSYAERWAEPDASTGTIGFGGLGLVHGELDGTMVATEGRHGFRIGFSLPFEEPPDRRFRIIAQLDSPGSDDPLIVGQWQTSIIALNSRDFRNEFDTPRVSANLSEYLGTVMDVDITFDSEGTRIDANGRFAASGRDFEFEQPLTRLSLGNSPDGTHGWTGTLNRFELFTPADAADASTRYDFANASDTQVPAIGDAGSGLDVPAPGAYPDAAGIGTLSWSQLLKGNRKDMLINFMGFMPLGFVIAGLMRTRARPVNGTMAVAVALLVGLIVTVGIEFAQTHIPGRSPHLHDLILNVAGTLPGAIAFLVAQAIAERLTAPRDTPAEPMIEL